MIKRYCDVCGEESLICQSLSVKGSEGDPLLDKDICPKCFRVLKEKINKKNGLI